MVTPIPTRYAGCHFRSRLEARWAVFFDAIDQPWTYEPEGFETPAGRYLPDFFLPDQGVWVEIKGGSFTKRDKDRAMYFAEDCWQNNQRYRVLIGDIPRGPMAGLPLPGIKALIYRPVFLPLIGSSAADGPDETEWLNRVANFSKSDALPFVKPGLFKHLHRDMRALIESFWAPAVHNEAHLTTALTAARSARFEFGQKGAQ